MTSIVISLYRSDRYLENFKKAIRDFSAPLIAAKVGFEIIAVANDASPAERVFGEFFRGQSWFKFVETPRESIFATWNRGVEMAVGEVLGFWNADDIRYPEAVVEAGELAKQGAEVIYFPFKIKRYINLKFFSFPVHIQAIEGKALEFEKRKFETGMPCGPHFMFTKAAYKAVGPFDEQFKIAGDFDWCARAAAAGLKFALGKEYSGIFRVDGNGVSAGGTPRHVAENNIILLRQHAWDKLQLAEDIAMQQYREKHLLYHGKFFPLAEAPGGKIFASA